jgi:hypothetical protein
VSFRVNREERRRKVCVKTSQAGKVLKSVAERLDPFYLYRLLTGSLLKMERRPHLMKVRCLIVARKRLTEFATRENPK